MDDGIVLRADLFLPNEQEKFPVIMTHGPYAKGLRYQEGYAPQWKWLIDRHPEILEKSTGSFLAWETVDPEIWVPFGYACVRVDSRGAGRSPGVLDVWSPRETRDFYDSIEWAGSQPWSNGNIGLCGISYYAINQWQVASLQPPHLKAMIAWEGAADHYRDMTHHGGILANAFMSSWFERQVLTVQHGLGKHGPMDPWMREYATGPETLSENELRANRVDYFATLKSHKTDDEYHRSRSADFSKIVTPFLSASNWGGFGLHERGNFEAFTQSGSKQKWLEVHGGRHEENFYLPYAVNIQKQFFDHFLKGIDNGWDREPRVLLHVRTLNGFVQRKENEWPLARTIWTKILLCASKESLTWSIPDTEEEIQFDSFGDGITFKSPPLEKETEITGPMSAKLFASSTTKDADLFLTFRAFSPEGKEIDFQGTLDPHTPLAQGWLRASHRKLDLRFSKPYRPYHPHDEIQPLKQGEVCELDVEIWPTCIVLPIGYRFALTVQGCDFARGDGGSFLGIPLRGSGPFLHNDPDDRPREVFGGKATIYTGGKRNSSLLLPIIPPKSN
jgi:predicted acyl esterase